MENFQQVRGGLRKIDGIFHVLGRTCGRFSSAKKFAKSSGPKVQPFIQRAKPVYRLYRVII